MKKLTLSLVAAGLSAVSFGAYAAVPTGAGPFQVIVPNIKSGFDFTLEGTYLEPTGSDLTYASTRVESPVANSSNDAAHVNPSFKFGYGLGVGYIFPNSGNDLRLNWTHFDNSSDSSFVVPAGSIVTTPVFNSFRANDHVTASSDVSFKHDAVDLDMGQYLSMGAHLQTRLFAGLRYTHLKNDVTDRYSVFDTKSPANTTNQSVDFDSKFDGLGPRVGIDTSYHLGDCFGVVAHFASALLVGRVKNDTTSIKTEVLKGVTTTFTDSFTTGNQTRVVPAIDGKLGVNYTWGFNHDTSNMTIEAGYQATQYIDAITRVAGDATYPGPVVTTNSSVGFNGPYLTVNFKI